MRAVALLLAAGCGDNIIPGAACAPPPTVAIEQDSQDNRIDRWDTHRAERDACRFAAGDRVEATLGEVPPFSDKLKHVIVILRENRSFDHYLGAYERPQHVPIPADASNPDRGQPVPRFHATAYCTPQGPDHEWTAAHLQFDHGRLDGFVAASNYSNANDGGREAMAFYNRCDIPFYYWLADEFAISESYHSSILGPTMPNISYYYNASSCGSVENIEIVSTNVLERVPWIRSCFGHSIFDELADAGVSARVYNDSKGLLDSAATGLTSYDPLELRSVDSFADDVAAEEAGTGSLADVVFIEPNYHNLPAALDNRPENDEHPPSNIQDGQQFVYRIIDTLMSQPNRKVFNSSVVFVTWDENGGYYDHVVPPPACAPDDATPCNFDFQRYGFRVPLFAISPFAKKNFAGHYTSDHTSILRFIETWKNLRALTRRDANAWPLLDLFDFDAPRFDIPSPPAPPSGLPCEPTSCP